MLAVGDKAPDIASVDCQGRFFQLSEQLAKHRVVVFFFPRSFSKSCTEEVRFFRDKYAEIRGLGAELVGVSTDQATTQCAFAQQERLDFVLLGDADKSISRAYGVLWPIVRIDRRATFVIEQSGVIADVFHHELRVSRHLDDVMNSLTKLKTAGGASP